MKRACTLAALCALSISSTVWAATSPKTLEVQFEYSTPAESFNLYMDGAKVCTTTEPNVMTCTDVNIPYGVHLFTMTAVVDSMETLHSPAYMWTYAPTPGPSPVFINLSVNGENVQLVPVNK